MGDIKCRKCGEPWDSYGVRNGDMEPEEARRFLRGEGCPCCKFGEKIPKDMSKDKLEEDFLFSLVDESDEDPIKVLERAYRFTIE